MPVRGPFLTGQQIADVWVQAGGDPATALYAVAAAQAESQGGTRSYHVNKNGTTDYGLWQINSSNGGSPALYQPDYGAAIAKRLSSNGTDWRQWCTAWTDGACGKHHGQYAPAGSSPMGAAYRALANIGVVKARGPGSHRTVRVGGASTSASPGKAYTLPEAWKILTKAISQTVPTRTKLTDDVQRKILRVVK